MGKTLVDIDLELLAQAQQVLGTTTKKATVNAALRELVRRWAAVEFGNLARSGILNRVQRVDAVSAAEPGAAT